MLAAAVVALVALVARVTSAQPVPAPTAVAARPSPSEVALARRSFAQGLAAARAGRWPEACVAFERAQTLAPRAVTLLDLANAQAHTGQLVAAAESYRRYLREYAQGPDAVHRAAAERALAAIEHDTPRLRVTVRSATAEDRVELDERVVSPAALDAELPLDPGPHGLLVVRGERRGERVEISLTPGESRAIELTAPARVAPVAPPPAVTQSVPRRPLTPMPHPPLRPAARSSGGPWTSGWFWALTGVVIVGAAGASVAYAFTRNDAFVGSLQPGALTVPR